MAHTAMRLPDLGEGLTEATIVRWLVDVGDVVTEEQAVAEVETAKATVELPAPFGGTVVERHADEGDEVEVGEPVLSIDRSAADPDGSAAGETGQAATGGADAGAAADDGTVGGADQADTGTAAEAATAGDAGSGDDKLLVGYGTGGDRRRRRRGRAGHDGAAGHRAMLAPADRPRAKPPVRKLAKDLGVDLHTVDGTGPEGRITRDDVRAAVEQREAPTAADRPARAEQAAGPEPTDGDRVPVTGVRARIADHLSTAWHEIPAAACWVECDATRLVHLRRELADAHPDVRVTPLALLLRCCAVALADHPELNASFDADDRVIVRHGAVHLGVATQTDRGLVVPVVRDAARKSVLELAAAVDELATAARDGQLAPARMVGSTFTVSNYGAFGVDGGTPIVNHPEAGILGIGRITSRPWIVDGAIAIREVVQLSLTFDHRVCDGGEAAGFLRRMADLVERPLLLLAH